MVDSWPVLVTKRLAYFYIVYKVLVRLDIPLILSAIHFSNLNVCVLKKGRFYVRILFVSLYGQCQCILRIVLTFESFNNHCVHSVVVTCSAGFGAGRCILLSLTMATL